MGEIWDNLTLCDDENELPNILDILGDKFKIDTKGNPSLSWQN